MTDPFAVGAPQQQQFAPQAPPAQPQYQAPPQQQQFAPQAPPQNAGGQFQQYQPAEMNPNPPAQWGQQPTAPEPANADTSGFFSGGGVSMSFADAGWRNIPRGGQIVAKRMGVQRDMDGKQKNWDDGTPRQQVIVTLQTNERTSADDDGKRDLYIKSGLVAAVREAIRDAGVGDLEIGGWLYVAWTADKPTTKGNPQKLFKAQYTRLGAPAPAQAGQPAQMPAQPAAPAQYAPPAAAPPTMNQQQAAGVFGAQQPPAPVANPFG
jgi:hypothetical protein